MRNNFLNGLANATNYTLTENGGVTHKTTGSTLYDMFGMGAAMRKRSDADCILMFRNAFDEDPVYALKCLFYIRDVRGGQGERRFFRVCMRDLASYNTEAARRNLKHIPMFGRWDDLYLFVGTPLEKDAFNLIKEQLALDVESKTPSLLAKWLKSENTSSLASRKLGAKTRVFLGMNHRQYRKTLSILRTRINILEKLMSAGQWDKIEFDKIPSRAGMIYKNAFARHDVERMINKSIEIQSYADFAKDTTKKVNAKVLYPYECVAEALKLFRTGSYWSMRELPPMDDTNRLMVNKYWRNLHDYIHKTPFNGIAVVDTSGSMVNSNANAPINMAISLGLYCAEKNTGPYANHYVSFASRPQLIETVGVDFCDKVQRIYKTNLVDNTNLEAVFDLLLNVAIQNHCSQAEIPQQVIIISDMQIDAARGIYGRNSRSVQTEMDLIRTKWFNHGYNMPRLIYWNVNASKDTILDDGPDVTYVSGASPSIFEQIIKGKTGYALMMDVLNSERYSAIS